MAELDLADDVRREITSSAVLRIAQGVGVLATSRGCSDGGWRKSSLSGNNECLEVSVTDRVVRVRDSKDQRGRVTRFSEPEWRAFLSAVRLREFD